MGLSIYKYFNNEDYFKSFIESGEICFHSLAYFRNCERKECKDHLEGIRFFTQEEGLEITKKTGEIINFNGGFIPSLKSPESAFIFCASKALSSDLQQKFGSYCVEIFNLEKFKSRIRNSIRARSKIKSKTLLADEVKYYHPTEELREVWACPEKIIMHKHVDFSIEDEYRFAFSEDKDAFDFNNVSLELGYPKESPIFANHRLYIFKLGDMSDICREITR